MNRQHFLFRSLAILASLCSISTVAIAETLPQGTPSESELSWNLTLPTPNIGSIASFSGEMSRCTGKIFPNQASRNYFRPLLPADYAAETAATGETSLWFYIPENRMVKVEFSLGADDDVDGSIAHYEELYNVDGRNGLLQITIPPNTIRPDTSYWWDLALVLDEIDRSADVFIYGSLYQQSLEQISLDTSPTALNLLTETLSSPTTLLSLDQTKSQELAEALQATPNSKTVGMVENQLREHFILRRQDYEELKQDLAELTQTSKTDSTQLTKLQQQHSRMALELAQLSAFFDLWGDTTNYLAMARFEHPAEWQSLLEALFLEKGLGEANEMINVMKTAQNF